MSHYTRKQYFEDLDKLREEFPGHLLSQKHREKAEKLHQKYYGQLVTEGIKRVVKTAIGMERLLASTDPHLNDIPLKKWDDLYLPNIPSMKPLGDYLTLAGKVCIAKEATRQLIEEAQGAN